MSITEILMYSIGSIFFFSVLIFTYYSFQCARVMKGAKGRRVMAYGAVLFIVAGIVGAIDAFFFPDSGLVYGAFSVWIIALITFFSGGFLVGKTIQGAFHVSLIKGTFIARGGGGIYYLIAFVVLIFLEVPVHILDILRPLEPGFSWYSVVCITVRAFCFINLAIGARLDYSTAAPSAAAAAAGGEEMRVLLSDDVAVLRGYSELTERVLGATLPVVGMKAVEGVLSKCAEEQPIILGCCRITEDGKLNIDPLEDFLGKIAQEERIPSLLSAFSSLNSELLHLYSAATSSELGKDVLDYSTEICAKRWGELPYLYGLPAILFRKTFESVLVKCSSESIEKVREEIDKIDDPIIKRLEIKADGRIGVDKIYYELAKMPYDKIIKNIIVSFSKIMSACYPIIQNDIGTDKANKIILDNFSEFLKNHGHILGRYELAETIPKYIELPEIWRIKRGHSYLVKEEKPETSFELFREMLMYDTEGLCISRMHPDEIKEKYDLMDAKVFWLSNQKVLEQSISPTNIELLRHRIREFAEKSENGVILLEGLEYLITLNGFNLMLRCLEDINDIIIMNNSRLIIPVNPETLDGKELAWLEKSMEIFTPVEVGKE